jgi:predicted nucleotidyltransferase
VSTPTLAPLFRSDLQFRLLGYLAAADGREATVTELSLAIDASYGATWAEVDRLLELGVLEERRVGRSKLVRLAEGPPYVVPLRQLLRQTYGPLPLLRDELQEIEGVVDAFVYGSWARRYAGEVAPAPGDVDVLVVVSAGADPHDVYSACSRVSDQTGQVVNATVLTADEWASEESAFGQSVRDGVRVGILGQAYGTILT